ncbi:hypothetical protein N9089_05300, partial [Crocinitomicaceae bacterium]|nr:hypothetical protein [Crocinitomicaceae bacterium]
MNETPIFIGGKQDHLFGVLHQPVAEGNGIAFVFCHPFAEEKLWAHRVFVNFARELVYRGYTVLRFDYLGYGDSDGNFTNCTLTTHGNDIERATSFLHQNISGIRKTGLLGLRLGASLAWLSAERCGINGPLILWDPILNGEDYLLEFLRSNLTTQLAIYGEIREDREQLIEKIRRDELVNVEGYELGRGMYLELASLRLEDHKKSYGGQVLVVQIGRNEKPKRQPAGFAESIDAEMLYAVEEPFWRE